MNATTIRLIRESYARAGADRASGNLSLTFIFYVRLFSRAPQMRALFSDDIVVQAEKLERMLQIVLGSLSYLDLLMEPLRDLGARHTKYGATTAHFDLIADALLETLAEECGTDWTDAHDAAWRELISVVNNAMIEGMAMSQPAA